MEERKTVRTAGQKGVDSLQKKVEKLESIISSKKEPKDAYAKFLGKKVTIMYSTGDYVSGVLVQCCKYTLTITCSIYPRKLTEIVINKGHVASISEKTEDGKK